MSGRLVVIPNDPLDAYVKKGRGSLLEAYYNPLGFFSEVYVVSPRETGSRSAYGMTIIGVDKRDFEKTIRELRPDVIRAYGGDWTTQLACRYRIPGIPVISSVHDTSLAHVKPAVRYADLVICMSQAVAETVLSRGADPKRIRILGNRINTRIFHPVDDPGRLAKIAARFPAGKHVLHVGRKVKQKNIDTVIRALSLLPSEYSVIFIGSGETADYCALADELGVGGRCHWIESITNEELPDWYSWCDCMCTPSRWEGFGIVFIESAACGAGIVTSNIRPMNEYLQADVSACLVDDYENPDAVARAIQRVCEDQAYREKIGQGAREVAKQFDSEIVDELEVAIYREAMTIKPLSGVRMRTSKIALTFWDIIENIHILTHHTVLFIKRMILKIFPQAVPVLKRLFRKQTSKITTF